MGKKISIIVPTYNEAENIAKLIPRIGKALSDHDYQTVVVDDDSPDKTWKRAEELSNKYPVKVIRRTEEKGLSTAVIKGIKEVNSEIIVVMDADLQHPPRKLPGLLKKIEEGANLAIGSRYIEGGKVENWGPIRRLVSKAGTFVAKALFPIVRKVSDPMTGYFAVKRDIIEVNKLNPIGFKILLEILVMNRPEKIEEVPITFKDREKGESSLDMKTNLNYLRHNLSLFKRSGELYRFLRFALVGISGILVNMGILFLLTEFLGIHYLISGFFAVQGAILSNFTWNKLWTFKDKSEKSILKALGKFELVSLGGKATNLAILFTLTEFLGIYYLLSNLLGIILACIVNYLGYNHWVWFKD